MKRKNASRHGMALLVILVLIVMAALGAYSFTYTMESQYRIARMHEDQVHARLAVASGIEMVASILEQPLQSRALWGPLDSNPDLFAAIEIDPKAESKNQLQLGDAWRFSILSPRINNDMDQNRASSSNRSEKSNSFVFGLQNESAKIHLPTLLAWDTQQPGYGKQVLMSLPGANSELADAVMSAASARAGNFKKSSFTEGMNLQDNGGSISIPDRDGSNLQTGSPGAARTQSSIWPAWLGGDLNQNYLQDPIEAAIEMSGALQASGQSAAMGDSSRAPSNSSNIGDQTVTSNSSEAAFGAWAWRNYLTWENGGRHETRDGRQRVLINQPDLQNLHRQLMEIWPVEWANYVIAFRQYGIQLASWERSVPPPAPVTGVEASSMLLDFSIPASFILRSPLDLVGGWVSIPANQSATAGNSSNLKLLSPFRGEISPPSNYLGKLLDDVTTDTSDRYEGRVDINDAPLVILAAVPGMSRELAEQIVQRRTAGGQASYGVRQGQESDISSRSTIAWLMEEGLVDLQQLTRMEPYLTARSDVYSCQVVGFKDDKHAVYRCTVTIDARSKIAEARDFQIWHPWDRGFETASLDPKNASYSERATSP